MAISARQAAYPVADCKLQRRPFDVAAADWLAGLNPVFKAGNGLVGKAANLPPVICSSHATRGVQIKMRDGTYLMTDVYCGIGRDGKPGAYPTILIRTPYNRKFLTWVVASIVIRGFHLLVQDCRGTGESGGTTELLAFEHVDGADTVQWIRAQPWARANPRVALWGVSFLGICIYAALSEGAKVDAVMPILSSSNFYSLLRPGGPRGHGGGFALGLMTRWHYATVAINPGLSLAGIAVRVSASQMKKHTAAAFAGPLCRVDSCITCTHGPTAKAATKTPLGMMIEAHLLTPPTHPFWRSRTYDFCESEQRVATSTAAAGGGPIAAIGAPGGLAAAAPVAHRAPPAAHLVGGWYDIFFGEMLDDYDRFREAEASHFGAAGARNEGGRAVAGPAPKPRVLFTVGPWHHFDQGPGVTAFREALWWFGEILGGRKRTAATHDDDAHGGAAADAAADSLDMSAGVLHTAPYRANRRRVMLYILGLGKKRRVCDAVSGLRSEWAEFDEFPPADGVTVNVPLMARGELGDPRSIGALEGKIAIGPHGVAAGARLEQQPRQQPPRAVGVGGPQLLGDGAMDAAEGPVAVIARAVGQPVATGSGSDRSTTYIYDPSDPAPTLGGVDFVHDAGPCDLSLLEARRDVVVWTTPHIVAAPAARVGGGGGGAVGGVTLVGRVSCTLSFVIDSDTIDFVVRLSHLEPPQRRATADASGGRTPSREAAESTFVCEGYRRIVLRDGHPASEAHEVLPDGRRRATVTVNMWATGLYLAPGSRLRVSVTSASHPKYARNLGSTEVDPWTTTHPPPGSLSGGPAANGTRRVRVEVVHGQSFLSLPVCRSVVIV